MDANFQLKNNLVSNYSQDPGLGTGWAYMVARAGYEEYVLSHASDDDVRHQSYSSALHRLTPLLRSGRASVFKLWRWRIRRILLGCVLPAQRWDPVDVRR